MTEQRIWIVCGGCDHLESANCTQEKYVDEQNCDDCAFCGSSRGVCGKAKIFEVRKGNDPACTLFAETKHPNYGRCYSPIKTELGKS